MIKQTTESCTYCSANIVYEEHEELDCSPFEVRYGGSNPMKTVSSGYFCSGCGLRYHRLPSEVKEYVRQQIVEQERQKYERIAVEKAKQEEWERVFKEIRENAVKTAKLMEECHENAAKSTLTFP